MNNYFECRVKYSKVDEISGKEKKTTEAYLVDAMSFTEAEARMHKELEQMISGDFRVTNMKTSNITELFPNYDGDRWFKAKVTFTDIDEASGKEKKVRQYMLVQANNAKEAYTFLNDNLSHMIVPYEIPSVSESPILDVFPYFTGEVNEEIPANLKPIKEVLANDDLLLKTADLIVSTQCASTSQLQRSFNLDYESAGRLIDQLENKGIIGPFLGSKPRKVLIPKTHTVDLMSLLM